MFATTNFVNNFPDFEIGASMAEASLSSLPFSFDKRHYKKDSRFVNDLYTLTYDDHESLDSVRLFSSFANQVSKISFPFTFCLAWVLCVYLGARVLNAVNHFDQNEVTRTTTTKLFECGSLRKNGFTRKFRVCDQIEIDKKHEQSKFALDFWCFRLVGT